MAVNYEAKEWKNDSVGNTPITAEELNRIDSGVAQVAEAVNALDEPGNVTTADIADGAVTADKLSQEVRDSVSRKVVSIGQNVDSVLAYNTSPDSGRAVSFKFVLTNGKEYTVTFDQNGIGLYDQSGSTLWFVNGPK